MGGPEPTPAELEAELDDYFRGLGLDAEQRARRIAKMRASAQRRQSRPPRDRAEAAHAGLRTRAARKADPL